MNEKITFPRLATLLADRSRRSKRFSEDFLREFFALISERLEEGESVKIKGLGTFRLSRVEPRRSVDVSTGLPMEISGHSKVVFVPSKELADAVNAPFEAFTAIEISDDADLSEIFSKDEISLQESSDDFSAEADFGVASDSEEEPLNEPSDESVISFRKKEELEIKEKDADILDDDGISEDGISDTKEAEVTAVSTIFEKKTTEPSSTEEREKPSESFEKASEDVNEEINSNEVADNNAEADGNVETDNNVEADNNDTDQTGQTKDSYEQTALSTDSSEDYEELETDQSRRNWVRTLMISLGAALFALIATFSIWYIFATNDFKNIFNSKTAATTTEGFVVGHNATAVDTSSITRISEEDSVSDTLQDLEEEEVPTAPSDALVYDTISTTRYLTTMAKAHYGNYNLWPYIYEENKAILGHPDRIRPGTPVVIPKLSKYGVDPSNPDDVDKAKKMGVEIYARYGKKI